MYIRSPDNSSGCLLLGLSVTDDDVTVSSCKTLLDSYILREGYRLTALFTTVERHSLSMCTTLISPDNSAVDIMFLSHQPQGMRRKIAMEVFILLAICKYWHSCCY